MFPDYQYVSLENENIRSFAQEDPVAFLKRYPEKIIFDEVQRVPQLFSYLQTAVDQSGMMGQFLTLIYGGDESQERSKYKVQSWRDL